MSRFSLRLGIEAGKDTHAAARELGVRGVPVNIGDLVRDGVAATLAALDGLEVCQIGAFGYNPLSDDADARAMQTDFLKKAIPLAAETGCPYIVICGGNHHPSGFGAWDARNGTDAAMDSIAGRLDPLVTLAADHGAKLSIEPYLKTAIDSPEAFMRLRSRMTHPDALVANLDVTSHYDFRDYADPGPRCAAVCEGYAGAYGLGHVKDIGLNDGFHLNMGLAPLGTSPTDWASVLRMMAPHMPDDGWLILEHCADLAEARASLAVLRAAAIEAGVDLT